MFVGGTDTTAAALEWAMSELVRNPIIMKKVQEEVRTVVGHKSKVEENDISQMQYLKCVVKETLRLHLPTPLLPPRVTMSNVKLKGFDIPAKTMVYINAWAMQRDPKFWERPEPVDDVFYIQRSWFDTEPIEEVEMPKMHSILGFHFGVCWDGRK